MLHTVYTELNVILAVPTYLDSRGVYKLKMAGSFFGFFLQMCKHNYIILFYNWSDYCSHRLVTHKGSLLYVEEFILFV